MFRAAALGSVAISIALLVAVPAEAKRYRSTTVAAPAYPESRIAMAVKGTPRAGGIATLKVSGSNASRDDGDGLAFDYTLDVFVHDRSVSGTCPRSFREARNRIANLPEKVDHIGIDLNAGSSGPFEQTIQYRTERFRRIMFCAYTTYVTDDAAMGALKHDLARPRRRR
jgi:hypothetical protein